MGEIKRETKMKKKRKKKKRDRLVWVNFEIRKNRKIDVVRESGKLRWEKKWRRVVREKYWDEKKKKKKDRHGREEINEKNSANFSNFPATQLLTSITSTKFFCEIKI